MNTITRLGLALYGDEWKRPAAAALHVDIRTLRRWASGEFETPPGVIADLCALADEAGVDHSFIAQPSAKTAICDWSNPSRT